MSSNFTFKAVFYYHGKLYASDVLKNLLLNCPLFIFFYRWRFY